MTGILLHRRVFGVQKSTVRSLHHSGVSWLQAAIHSHPQAFFHFQFILFSIFRGLTDIQLRRHTVGPECRRPTDQCHRKTTTRAHQSFAYRLPLWLPVWRLDDIKLALLIYKCLRGLAPTNLSQDCQLVSSDTFRRRLRPTEMDTCIILRTRTRFWDHSFAVAIITMDYSRYSPWLW